MNLWIQYKDMLFINYIVMFLCCWRKPKHTQYAVDRSVSMIAFSDYLNGDIQYNNTVPFVPNIKYGKVIKVYDGDTIIIAAKYPSTTDNTMYRFSVRLNGIDSPEIKGKTNAEKELARKSRDMLHDLIYNKVVSLENVKTEKYGRLLADVHFNNTCINTWMLDNGLAIPYDGGTKIRPDEWNDKN